MAISTRMCIPMMLALVLVHVEARSQSRSAIQFYDSTGEVATCKLGWTGDAANGSFFIRTPNDGNGVIVENGDLTANSFVGDGSGLSSLPVHTHTSGDISGKIDTSNIQYGTHMITSAGQTGQVWKVGADGRGFWATDSVAGQGSISWVDVGGLQAKLNEKADTSVVGNIQAALATKANTNTVNGQLLGKADTASVYTRTQVEDKVGAKPDTSSVYTKPTVDSLLNHRATLSAPSFVDSITTPHIRCTQEAYFENDVFINTHGGTGFVLQGDNGFINRLGVRVHPTEDTYFQLGLGEMADQHMMQFRLRGDTSSTYINTHKFTLGRSNTMFHVDGLGVTVNGSTNDGYKFRVRGGSAAVDAGQSWTTLSDRRLKRDIEPLGPVLSKISHVRGIRYRTIGDSDASKEHIGFIAQEIEEMFPEVVTTNDEGYKGVDYGRMSAVLLEAVKELKKENEALREEVALIKQRIR